MIRRITHLLVVALAACGAQAQTHRLVSLVAETGLEEYRYYYDAENRLDSAYSYWVGDIEYFTSDKYVYDDRGLLVGIKGYQLMEGDDVYTHITQIDYTYDDRGNLIKRVNYNNLDPSSEDGFVLGGVYEYVFDENNRMTTRNAYWDLEQTDLFEVVRFTYNDEGLRETESYYSIGWSGEEEFSSGITYVYEEGRLTEKKYQMQDFITGAMMDFGGEVFTYDADGDVVCWVKYSSTPDDPSQKEIYAYDKNLRLADAVLPENPEDDNEVARCSQHVIEEDSVYSSDFITGALGFYDVYYYTYEPISGSSVAPVSAETSLQAFVNASGRLVLMGLEEGSAVRIYSLNGQLLRQAVYTEGGGIDLSGLSGGVYCVSSPAGIVKFHKR